MRMWNSVEDLDKKILIDSDVIRHFIRGKKILKLKDIFPNQLYILDMVELEICRSKSIAPYVEEMINNGGFIRMNFPTGKRFLDEYGKLINDYGTGEAACMAVARHSGDVIASNNLRDIKIYCNDNAICYLTTIDILYVAFKRNVMTEADIDLFLHYNYTGDKPSKIPFITLEAFISTNPEIHLLFKQIA